MAHFRQVLTGGFILKKSDVALAIYLLMKEDQQNKLWDGLYFMDKSLFFEEKKLPGGNAELNNKFVIQN
ncbi:MAG: hypothetical protein NTX38_02705 [Methylobacter sp.]|nr:hypothetical protein [Methylobacter sp.]